MFRFLVLLVLVGLAAAWWLGYVPPLGLPRHEPASAVHPDRTIDTERARQRGAEVGERLAQGVNRVAQGVDDAALTAKIKAKMTLDDTIRSREIRVTTAGGLVTLAGTVHNEDERRRALQLARETDGVRSVTDQLRLDMNRVP